MKVVLTKSPQADIRRNEEINPSLIQTAQAQATRWFIEGSYSYSSLSQSVKLALELMTVQFR